VVGSTATLSETRSTCRSDQAGLYQYRPARQKIEKVFSAALKNALSGLTVSGFSFAAGWRRLADPFFSIPHRQAMIDSSM